MNITLNITKILVGAALLVSLLIGVVAGRVTAPDDGTDWQSDHQQLKGACLEGGGTWNDFGRPGRPAGCEQR